MKNLVKLMGIIALVAVIGFTFAACSKGKKGDNGGGNGGGGGGTGGTFTLTGIPSQYNGNWALLSAMDTDSNPPVSLGGYQSKKNPDATGIFANLGNYNLVRISGGRVSMPMWDQMAVPPTKYSGNHTFPYIIVSILDMDTNAEEATVLVIFNARDVTFTNGSATKAWSEGVSRDGDVPITIRQ